MFLFFCDGLFQTEFRVLKRSCFCLRERRSLKRKFTVFVLCSQNENSTASCCLWPVVHSDLDFSLVKSYCKLLFHACSVPNALRISQPMTKRSNKHAMYVRARRRILYILLILFATADGNSAWYVASTNPADFSANLTPLLLFPRYISCLKPSVFDIF